MGGTLAAITTADEHSAIVSWLAAEGNTGQLVWIGGSDIAGEGEWQWVTGEAFVYEEMSKAGSADGGTVQNCLTISMYNQAWNDYTCGSTLSDTQEFRCPKGWIRIEISCYYLATGLMTWADAELHCEELGGTLAAITTQDESSSIFAWLANEGVATGSVWIGGNDIAVEGTWEWSTGEELRLRK
ncbi:perlucin-like protein [Mya arenaria]|uniref:perlucin-like protein n=1 Tax=Mya arenaria TaxID=6604 RepID=UPI0022E08CD5|nr:perlucin-like protein [Mya arenaria]